MVNGRHMIYIIIHYHYLKWLRHSVELHAIAGSIESHAIAFCKVQSIGL